MPILIRDMNKNFWIFSILISIGLSLHALDIPSRKIEDDSSLRISLRDTWFSEVPDRVLNRNPENYTLRGGSRIQVRSESGRDEFLVVLARELTGP